MRKRVRDVEWEVIRVRYRGERLCQVRAPDEQAALKAAVELLELDDAEAKRLMVRRA